MKQSNYLKLILVLPLLVFALVSCTKKEGHFITGMISTTMAIQQEVDDPEDGVIKVFYPNIVAQAISDGTVINPNITKSAGVLANFSPYSGHAETDIQGEVNRKSSLNALNGTYYFVAHNERAQEVSIWTEWAFSPNHEFSQGWGEFEANESDRKIKKFTYTNGTIELAFNTLPQDVPVSYYMIIMEAEHVSMDVTRLVREWKDARPGDTAWPISPSASEGHFVQSGFNAPRFDKKKVFLAAVKNYGSSGSPMMVMLLSNPKTINIEKGVFDEDNIPPDPNPGL